MSAWTHHAEATAACSCALTDKKPHAHGPRLVHSSGYVVPCDGFSLELDTMPGHVAAKPWADAATMREFRARWASLKEQRTERRRGAA